MDLIIKLKTQPDGSPCRYVFNTIFKRMSTSEHTCSTCGYFFGSFLRSAESDDAKETGGSQVTPRAQLGGKDVVPESGLGEVGEVVSVDHEERTREELARRDLVGLLAHLRLGEGLATNLGGLFQSV